VVKRCGSEEEWRRLSELWEELGIKMLYLPEDDFKIEFVKVPEIERAPIFNSVRCTSCGELVMEIRSVNVSGKPYCLKCAGERYYAVIGRGIVEWRG